MPDGVAELTQDLLASTSSVPAQFDLAQVREMLRVDPEFFINFFLGEEITVPVPDFHKVVFGQMVNQDTAHKYFACAIPRDHAKTTLAKLAVIWFYLFSPYRFVLYLSNTAPIAIEACRDIANFIESENFVAVFGAVEWIVRQEGTGLYKFKLALPGGKEKVCILRALGAGQQVRGINIDNQRPELAIVDDLESKENTATPHLRKQLKEWFFGTFRKALDKFNHKIVQIGNLVSPVGILKDNLESEYWTSMRLGAILSNGQPLWPDAWPILKLQAEFDEYHRAGLMHVWFGEMMNIPIPEGSGLIASEEIRYMPAVSPGDCEYGFITIDPAISEKTWADKSAIVAHGWLKDERRWVICEHIHQSGLDPLYLINSAIRMAIRWRFAMIGVESVAYQAALVHFFKYILVKYQHLGIQVVPLFASAAKTTRLAAWCAYIREGTYYLPRGDLEITSQLLLYDPSKRDNEDDLIDACAYGPQMIEMYLPRIRNTLLQLPEAQVLVGAQVAPI